MTEPTAEPTTLQLVIDATCYVAPPERHQFIRDTLTQLWTVRFIEWYQYLVNVGNYIHVASHGRLLYNLVLDGFGGQSTAGTVGLALYDATDKVPLCRLMLAFWGDFAGGLANADKVRLTVAEMENDWSLPKARGAALDSVESLTFGQLAEIARRAVALLDRAAEPNPKPQRWSWWARLWGRTRTGKEK